ncbi:unnamed protein product [Allacma fusca]|uniref:G-patch domain-containing protein n=1 Tax=Allacma fusca TaxID=39272 RepID=A0A8J2KJ65_9HEXA|nr:unnamed protein product [Allacma fusca]
MEPFDDDDDNFVVFGTALEPIEDDEVARKKPVNIQDQVVLDENGRRRFHGAFTGGFSAGYYNTVGSKEGWAPTAFKSTRSDRSSAKVQSAQDFMDEEDLGAFGIAPQVLRPTEDFQSKRREGLKRPRPTPSDGPIPGDPVLFNILQPVKETIGIKVLRKMGWRPGQGVGPKVLKKKKKKREDRIEDEENQGIGDSTPARIYGCALPPPRSESEDESGSDDDDIRALLVAPDEVTCPLYNTKDNNFGLGYQGLDKNSLSSGHVDLFGPALKFKVDDRKMDITGEAFGIGVFEEADEEVYSREDMTQYDFALETPHERKRRLRQEARDKEKKKESDASSIPGFMKIKNPPKPKRFSRPRIPEDFVPVHTQKKSRFSEDKAQDKIAEIKKLGLDRHNLSRQERHVLLEDDNDLASRHLQTTAAFNLTSETNKTAEIRTAGTSKEIAPSESEDREKDAAARVERLKKFTEILQNFSSQKPKSTNAAFQPFMKHPGKQERYDSYLTLKAAGYAECLKDLQPPEMTEWERDREKLEFDRASELYKPMSGEMSSRFVSAKSHDISHMVPEREREKEKDPSQDPKVAAKMNLFGKLTHQVLEWHPDRLVCKRFNVPPPYPDSKMVGVRIGIEDRTARVEPELQESISKKSLFDGLDFSKPPPGLVPVASQLPPIANTAPTSASGQPQLEFLSTQPATSPTQETPSNETTSPTKPPLDLFKEIFADTSESENEADEKLPESGSKERNIDRQPRAEGGNTEHSKKHDGDKEINSEMLHKEKSPSNATKSQHHEERKGIFHNLDFSKLASSTDISLGSKISEKGQKQFPRGLPSTSVTASSKVKEEEEDAMDDEPTYGPAPPSNFLSAKKPSSELATSQTKRSYNYSSISNVGKKSTQSLPAPKEKEEIVWIEKNVLESSSSKTKRKHSKKNKSHHHRRSSKSKKVKKHKSSSSKHKSKKEKRRSSKSHSNSKSGHGDKSQSSSSSSEQSDTDSDRSSSNRKDYPSVSIYSSDNTKALIAKLKEMI